MKNITQLRRIEAGLCVECGVSPARPGHTRCEACTQAEREYNALRYRAIKDEHRCVYCKRKMRDEWQGTMCRKCLTMIRKRRKQAKKNGVQTNRVPSQGES